MASISPGLSLTPESLGDLKEYQINDAFPPDKEKDWTIPFGKDGWSLSHNGLRGEMEFFTKALAQLSQEEQNLDPWMVISLQAMWKHHRGHVISHQTAEDTILQPALEARFKYPEKAGEGHKELEGYLQSIDAELDKFAVSPSSVTAKTMQSAFQSYDKAMREHLHAEEVLGVTLMRAFFTQAEFKPIGREMGKSGGPPGSFVYFFGVDEFRNDFMKSHNMPFFLWWMVFAPAVQEFENDFLRHAKALTETHQEPPPPVAVSPYSCIIL